MKPFKRFFAINAFMFLLLVLLLFYGCVSGPIVIVTQPVEKDLGSSIAVLKAGAGEVDITPPPGLSLFGYSREAASKAVGYWTRLKSRAIVFEYFDSHRKKTRRLALVQLDLGAVSGLLHRQVAQRLAYLGFSPGDILLAASHTHGAPGGYFGAAFYNLFASGKKGFYPQLVSFLSQRIAKSVVMACDDLAPARIAAGKIRVPGLSRGPDR